jgi:chromosome partitioning protein
VIRSSYIPNLDIIPGNLELMEFEHDTPRALRDGNAGLFFFRVKEALNQVDDRYDVVVIDCPPQLGFLTMSALSAATGVLVTIHPEMLDVMSMSQFLRMTADLMDVIADSGADLSHDWMRYLLTRYEPADAPQNRIVAFLRTMYGEQVLNAPMLKSTAISDAGLTKQTLYEVERSAFTRTTYDRAIESLNAVNDEIADLIQHTWGRG